MKFGGMLPKATMARTISAFGLCQLLACGAQSPAPKAADPVPPSASVEVPSVAGAPNQGTNEGAALDRDPSKLLEAYDADHPREPVLPAKPSRSGLTLEVFERGPDQPWLVHIVNRGQEPTELVADTRLLWFEVKLPDKKKASLCRLPEPLSPGNQPEARLVVHLDPGEGVADQFDPRLYCFAEGEQKMLVPGAEITPYFGWPETPPKKRWRKGKLVEEPALQKPPFVARISQPLQTPGTAQYSSKLQAGVSPQAAARLNSAAVSDADKHLAGAPLTLKSEYAQWARPGSIPAPHEAPEQPPPAVGFRLVQGSDARAEHEATVELSVSNQSPLPVYVYFRRDMVTFEVIGPNGVSHCPGRLEERRPERSSFLHLTRGASGKYAVRVAELCPRGTFGIPGLYLVYARFDAMLDGADQGINAFVGPIYSKTPATVRIRTGEQEIFRKRPMLRTESSIENNTSTSGGQK